MGIVDLWSRRAAIRRSVVVLAALALTVAGTATPAAAAVTDPNPADNPCIANSTFSLTASRTSVVWGQAVVLTVAIKAADGCLFTSSNSSIQFIDPQNRMNYSEPFGWTATLVPPGTGQYDLVVTNSQQVYHVASVGVQVSFPRIDNHPFAHITPNIPDEAVTFEQIVQQDDARVFIQGDVDLNLNRQEFVPVHPGVQIIGERDAAHPNGPRLFTTTFPRQLLLVGTGGAPSDNVRITGVRFDGMEPSDPCDNAGVTDSDAISVFASTGVQIDHDEFRGWRGAAVNVNDNDGDLDPDNLGRLNPVVGKAGVWVHDNYIHDNQHPTVCSDINPAATDGHGGGYGVADAHGGFSYIQGNFFSDNRHSVEGGGENGSGYILTGNLFLNPGVDDKKVITNYNHQIDMHGTDTCDGFLSFTSESYNCGQGGVYMEVANNTVAGFTAAAIQLRGQPWSVFHYTPGVSAPTGMYVHDNRFNQCESCALTQTFDSNGLVHGPGNVFSTDQTLEQTFLNYYNNPGAVCDFDGDGNSDGFANSAGALWYHSSRFGHWTYMTTKDVTGSLTFADVNGDGLCDVSKAGAVVYQMPPLFESFPRNTTVPNIRNLTESDAQDALAVAGLRLDVARVRSFSPVGAFISQSAAAGSTVQAGSVVVLTLSAGGLAVVPNVIGRDAGSASTAIQNAGLWPQRGQNMPLSSPDQDGIVITQNPAAGAVVDQGSFVGFAVGQYSPKNCAVVCPGR